MTTEERIAQLEAELARERSSRERLERALEDAMAAVRAAADDRKAIESRRAADRERKNASRARRLAEVSASRDRCDDMSRDCHVTTPPSSSSPFPSSFPPSSEPPSPYPLSFPPSSPPSPIPPASQAAPRAELQLEQQEPPKRARQKRKDGVEPDPRHSRLVKALTAEGWPFDGGRDAANVTQLLALADQQEVTRGELAGQEVLRRARIAWAQFPGFHSARTLAGLRSKWGEFSEPDMGGRGPAPPSDFSRNVPLPERSEFAPPVDDTPF